MAVRSSQADVQRVLGDLQNAIRTNRFVFINRTKNMATLSSLGLLMSDVRDVLMHLTFAEYTKGPETDRDQPSSDPFWFFKKTVCGQVLYIKFKIEYQTDGKVKVVSFHIDEP